MIYSMSELDLSELLTVDQAIRIIDSVPLAPRRLELPLAEAQGLYLAEDLRADRPYPPFDKSLMDGYALRSADVTHPPAELTVIGEVAAGQLPSGPLAPGQAMAIMTGAPLPPGADGVVPFEQVQVLAETPAPKRIRISAKTAPSRYIAKAGSDAKAGDLALPAGTRLEAAALATAAMIGAATVRVFAPPRVAILATGDEIVPFDQAPAPAQIRNSNSLLLMALLRRQGCQVIDLGLVPDNPDLLRKALLKGLHLDALFVTGGMSMGKYDFVPRLLLELGVDLKITKLRIKPGKPFVFGTIDRPKLPPEPPTLGPVQGTSYVFGLPGNPVSAFVCTHRLASRLLTRLAGGAVRERWLIGQLQSPLPPNGPREFYLPVKLDYSPSQIRVHPLTWRGSADLFSLAQATALLPRPENAPALPPGAPVPVLSISDE